MNRLGVVTGLAVEARLLASAIGADPRIMIACAGADPDRARAAAERLIAGGADRLLSFGLAGGLDPGLRPGELVVSDRVIDGEGRSITTSTAWLAFVLQRLSDQGTSARVGAIATSRMIIANVAEKRRMASTLGALAVDNESYATVAAASEKGLLVGAIRAVADPAWRDLPQVALAPVSPEGRIRSGAVAAALFSRPWEWLRVLALARETQAGLNALRRVARSAPLLLA